jgi:type IV pilus assembly protein PilN
MVRINLLPVRVSKKKEAGKQQLVLFAVVLAAGILGNGLWTRSRSSELKKVDAKVAKTKADIAQLDKIIGEVKSLRSQQQALQEKLDVLDKLKQGRTGPVKMLDELATITPKRLWLRKMEEKVGKVTFDGTASSIDDVSVFMTALKGSKYFADVELKRTAAKTEGGYRVVDFTVHAIAKYAPGVEATADAKAGSDGKAAKKAGG